jgi:hypothetical protein
MGHRFQLVSIIGLGIATVLIPGRAAFAEMTVFNNGNPGDWADTSGNPLSVTTSNSGGPAGAGYTTLPNIDGFTDNGPYTLFGYTTSDTSSYQWLSQSIAVYLDPNSAAYQSGQFMLDETPSSTVNNSYGGSSSPQLWGAEEDIIVTGTATGITFAGSTGFDNDAQVFSSLGTVTQAGWYDLQMTWSAGAAPTDPVVTTLSVTDLTSSTVIGSSTSTANSGINGGEADLYQSQYLGGPGYLWFTYWDSGFSNGQLDVASVEVQVPEPTSLMVFLSAAAAMAGLSQRRKRA